MVDQQTTPTAQIEQPKTNNEFETPSGYNLREISTSPIGKPIPAIAKAAQLAETAASNGATSKVSQNTRKQELLPAKLTSNAHKALP